MGILILCIRKTPKRVLLQTVQQYESYFHLPVGEQGATYNNIKCGNITIYGERKGSLPGIFAHLNELSIRSFDGMNDFQRA